MCTCEPPKLNPACSLPDGTGRAPPPPCASGQSGDADLVAESEVSISVVTCELPDLGSSL